MQLKIAAIYAAVNIILLLILGARTAMTRQRRRVVLGDGGDAQMQLLVRAHGNAAEWIPAGIVGLVLMALFAPATPLWLLHAAGASLTGGRILHGVGLSMGQLNLGRVLGMVLTLIAYALIGGSLLWLGVSERF